MSQTVVGWCDTYTSTLPVTDFSESKRQALIERIRKRRYDFNYNDYQFLSYCCPVYQDKTICILTKQQFDNVMDEAWRDIPRAQRLMPVDVIQDTPSNEILFEKNKFKEQFMEQNTKW